MQPQTLLLLLSLNLSRSTRKIGTVEKKREDKKVSVSPSTLPYLLPAQQLKLKLRPKSIAVAAGTVIAIGRAFRNDITEMLIFIIL